MKVLCVHRWHSPCRCAVMAHHQAFGHDERILQALLRLTRAMQRDCSEDLLGATELPLDPESLHDAIDADGWDVHVRSRPPRA